MPNPEEDHDIGCPYCGAVFSVRIDNTAGSHQSFVIDCENCCRPIEVEAVTESDGYVSLVAKREGEG